MATAVKDKPRRDYRTKDGTRVPGVTTVLGNLGWKTPGLVIWSFREGQKHPELSTPYEITEEAADIGTVVHRAVELVMHGAPTAEAEAHIRETLAEDQWDRAESSLLGFYRWRDSSQVEVVDTEVALVSELGFGGTIDYVARVGGVLSILDLKTSKAVYGDMLVQVAAYGRLWTEHHPDQPISDYYILRIDKESAGFDYAYRSGLTEAWDVFRACLTIHQLKRVVR